MSPHSTPEQIIKNLSDTIKDLENRIRQMMADRNFPFGASNANLYLATTRTLEAKNWRERLLRWLSVSSFFKLKPFGEPHDPMARNSLYFAQWLLTGIFIMELVGWALMFNEVLNAGVLKWSFASFPAIFFGLIFAFGIISLEQAILTADVIDGWGKKKLALAIRIVLIACSAAITTQPYELLFFSSEVKDRIHQESIRAEIALRYHTYLQFIGVASTQGDSSSAAAGTTADSSASSSAASPSGGVSWLDEVNRRCPDPQQVEEPSPLRQPGELPDRFDARKTDLLGKFFTGHRDDCSAAIDALPDRITTINNQISKENADLVQVGRRIAAEAASCDQKQDPAESECVRQLRSLRASERGINATLSGLRAELGRVQASEVRLQMNKAAYGNRIPAGFGSTAPEKEVEAGIGASATSAMIRVRIRQLQNYLDKLVTSKPETTIQLEPYRGVPETPFHDQEYGVTNKVRVLYEELSGSSYQWPSIDPKLKRSIQDDFGLRDPMPGWKLYRIVPWAAVLLAAMFLPFVSLGYKLTLNENLNLYYKTEFQAQLGHVGAFVATEAKERFWELHQKNQNSSRRADPGPSGEHSAAHGSQGTRGSAEQPPDYQAPYAGDNGATAYPPRSDADAIKVNMASDEGPDHAGYASVNEGSSHDDPAPEVYHYSAPKPDDEPWRGKSEWNSALDFKTEQTDSSIEGSNGSGRAVDHMSPSGHVTEENPEI